MNAILGFWKKSGARASHRRRLAIVLALALPLLGGLAFWGWAARRDDPAAYFRLKTAVPASGDALALALYQSLGVQLSAGHTLTHEPNGRVFDALASRIEAAKVSVNIVMYIWERGAASERVVSALVTRARAGVRCRILVDDVGSPDFSEEVAPPLLAAGCDVRVFRPLSGGEKLARNHRKLVIVDGKAAVTGGFGIRDTWLGDGVHAESWRDANVSFTGPAVTSAQQAFAENWQEAGGSLLPAAEFPPPEASGSVRAAFVGSSAGVLTRAERLTQLLISAATRRLWIANAYFVPSRGVLELVKQKARAHVDVRILAPYKNSDSKTAFGAQHVEYGDLVEAGARVWEYTPSMMHAKTMIVDDELASIGSINLDPLSLNELEENALVVQDRAFADELGRAFVADCARSKPYSD
ncbi:MAG: Cardiolipin synthetase [Myxococcales bacterium]|nr:MAG: Cardiolipin synthetase [Myxococcales bacterium]